jgi:Zn-dependent peptidase ImmA (M78 family)
MIIEESIQKILDKINIDIPKIKVMNKKEVYNKYGYKKVVGLFDHDTKEIILTEEYLRDDYCSQLTIFHEIGHYIHNIYFNNRKFRFSRENSTSYSHKDYMENFAEGFKQWMCGFDIKRVKQMDKILSELKI